MRSIAPVLRGTFLLISVVFLIAGLYLFLFAESVATLPPAVRGSNPWPWPLGPLALRFVATYVLVAAVAFFLVARRLDAPTVVAYGTLGTIFGGLLLVHALLNWSQFDQTKPIAFVWLGVLAVGVLASALLALYARREEAATQSLLPSTPLAVRRITLFLLILNGLVGSTMFFFPGIARDMWPWDLGNSLNVQLLGSVFFGGALAMLWVWRRRSWYGYDILFALVGTYSSIVLVATYMHWGLFADRPIRSLLFVILYVVGVVLGFYAVVRHGPSPIGTRPPVVSAMEGH